MHNEPRHTKESHRRRPLPATSKALLCRLITGNAGTRTAHAHHEPHKELTVIGKTLLGMRSHLGRMLTLALVGACLFLQACDSASSQASTAASSQASTAASSQGNTLPPPPPPTPPATPTVTIDSPANDAVVTSLPLTLQLSFTNATETTQFRALLDGVDITSQFGPISDGRTQAQVTKPAVNFGKNQLQVTIGSQRASARFTYNPHVVPGALPGPDGSGPALAQLVPIQTRVLKSPTADPTQSSSWGIQLGNEATGVTSYMTLL
jgi:hypothetical protein